MNNNRLDMTQGNVLKLLIRFTLPSLASSLLTQSYHLADSLIVGQLLGKTALAAVGVCSPLVFLIGSMIIGLNIGVSITISQYVGKHDYNGIRHVLANSIYLGLILGFITIILGFPLAGTILRLMGTPVGPLEEATSYLQITFLATPFPIFYYMFSNAFRGIGDSKTPLYCLIISSVCNIGLDYLFIAGFQMGVAGSAYATALAQGLSVLFAMVMLYCKYPELRLRKHDLRPNLVLFRDITKLALPIAAQHGFNNLGSVLVQGCVNSFGETVMASYTVASRLTSFCLMPTETIGSSLSVYTGQNFGAHKNERIRLGVRASMQINIVVSATLALGVLILGEPLFRAFMDTPTPKYVSVAFESLVFAAIPGIIYGCTQIYQQVLWGIGKAAPSTVGSFLQLATRLLVAAIGTFILKELTVVWIAWPISYVAGFLYPYWYYKKKTEFDIPVEHLREKKR